MKVDEEATKAARKRHNEGVERMTEFFSVSPAYKGVGQDQRWLSGGKVLRRVYRRARIKADPKWADRRTRRKRQRRARKENR
jgi:hypothetical protein